MGKRNKVVRAQENDTPVSIQRMVYNGSECEAVLEYPVDGFQKLVAIVALDGTILWRIRR